MLNDTLHAVVSFCRTSTHVEVTRLFPLMSAYLCIYVDEDVVPDLLMNWYVSTESYRYDQTISHVLPEYELLKLLPREICNGAQKTKLVHSAANHKSVSWPDVVKGN